MTDHDLSKWTILSLTLTTATLIVGLVILATKQMTNKDKESISSTIPHTVIIIKCRHFEYRITYFDFGDKESKEIK